MRNAKKFGEKRTIYRARVLGEFPDQAEDTLISLTDIEAAAQRRPVMPDGAAPPPVVLSVDVARFGSDRSVILTRRGTSVENVRTFRNLDTMQLSRWVAAAIRDTAPEVVFVDEIGVGAGVVNRLREQGFPVRGINVARRARQEGLFTNLRAEGYWQLRELFASGEIAIPNDSQLIGELAALRYSFDSQGRIQIKSKDTMRQRGLPSPDKADALMLAFIRPANKMRLWT